MLPSRAALCAAVLLSCGLAPAAEPTGLTLAPKEFVLRGRGARQRLLVTGVVGGRPVDLTRAAAFRSDAPAVARVGDDGVVTPVGDGTATIRASAGGRTATATVTVIDGARLLDVTFERDVIPVLTRAGCNAGACHGKARGQNGFALSLLSYDPDFDYNWADERPPYLARSRVFTARYRSSWHRTIRSDREPWVSSASHC